MPFVLNVSEQSDRSLLFWRSNRPWKTFSAFCEHLRPLEASEAIIKHFFQQAGALPHYSRKVQALLDAYLPGLWIGRGSSSNLPDCSPDLIPIDLFEGDMWMV